MRILAESRPKVLLRLHEEQQSNPHGQSSGSDSEQSPYSRKFGFSIDKY